MMQTCGRGKIKGEKCVATSSFKCGMNGITKRNSKCTRRAAKITMNAPKYALIGTLVGTR